VRGVQAITLDVGNTLVVFPVILNVGDDPGADVVGAHGVGWRATWVRLKPADSPLPVAPASPEARPDLTIDSILELKSALGR